jgi:hypothetical protein
MYFTSTVMILERIWRHGEKVGYCYPSGLEKTLCKWEIYVPLVPKELRIWFVQRRGGLCTDGGKNCIF